LSIQERIGHNHNHDEPRIHREEIDSMKNSPILIISKNGKTGSRVNQRLQFLGHQTRAVSRTTTPTFDWEDSATWPAAMQGVRSAYVSYQPDLALPKAEAAIREFLQVARQRGLEHIVLLSGRGEKGAQRAEQILIESGLAWNIVRCSWFSQNFSENFMLEGILSGALVLPATDTPEPFVDADDIADVSVAVLTGAAQRNKIFELTGPRALTFGECMEEISTALGRQVTYVPVPVDAYIDELRSQGYPNDLQWLIRELFTVVFDGRNTPVKQGVEEALGRPATDFTAYVQKTLASGIWHAAATRMSGAET
jgi:uncharacterized protein YbjT (DUF2867 family)